MSLRASILTGVATAFEALGDLTIQLTVTPPAGVPAQWTAIVTDTTMETAAPGPRPTRALYVKGAIPDAAKVEESGRTLRYTIHYRNEFITVLYVHN